MTPRRSARALLLLGALAVQVPLFARPCRADDRGVDEGRTRFSRGIDLYKEGNFHAALAEFRAAYAAAPSFRIHYNLGQTLYQLQDYAGAVRAFEAYLAEGGDKVDAERRREVDGELAKLRQRVARLTVVTNVPKVELTIDDEPRAEPQPVLVSAGRRRVSVTASGYQTETRVIDVAGAKNVELKVELKPIGGPAAMSPKAAEPAPTRPKSRAPFYIGLAATGALAAGTATFAILTSKKHSEYEDALGTPGTTKATIEDLRSSTRTMALVADIFAGATLAGGALTVVAFVLTSGNEPAPGAAAPATARVRPVVGPSALGLVGTF